MPNLLYQTSYISTLAYNFRGPFIATLHASSQLLLNNIQTSKADRKRL